MKHSISFEAACFKFMMLIRLEELLMKQNDPDVVCAIETLICLLDNTFDEERIREFVWFREKTHQFAIQNGGPDLSACAVNLENYNDMLNKILEKTPHEDLIASDSIFGKYNEYIEAFAETLPFEVVIDVQYPSERKN